MKQYRITMPDDKGIKYESFRYPGGEVQVKLKESELSALYEARELYVTANITDGDVMELALLTDVLKINGPNLITSVLYLPYLPYGRADRRFVNGDCFGLKVFVDLLDTLGYDNIETLDAHSPVSEYFGIANHTPQVRILDVANEIKYQSTDYYAQITYVFPDEGAKRYGLRPSVDRVVQASKVRDPKTGKLSGFDVPLIHTSTALIVDDICDGGRTFIGLAEAIHKNQPGVKLFLYVTHGIFSNGFNELEKNFERIYVLNAIKNSIPAQCLISGRVKLIGGRNGL